MARTILRRITDTPGALRMADHDLLIKIDTQLTLLTGKVEELSRMKGDQIEVTDHEARLRALESLMWRGLGALAVTQVLFAIGLVLMQIVLRK